MSKLLWIIPVCQVTFVRFFSDLLYWLNIFSHPCPLQMPDPEPSLLASSLHSSGRSGRAGVSHRDLPLGRGDGLPKRSNNHHRFPHPLGCALTWGHTLHYSLLGFGACERKHNPSVCLAQNTLISAHRGLPVPRKCSGEPRCCWSLLLRHKPFVEPEKRPASIPNKANGYLWVESWRASTANSLAMPRPEKSWLYHAEVWKIVPGIFPKWAVEWW